MKELSIEQKAKRYDEAIATHIDNADDYDTDDIVMWTEIPKLNDKL